MRSSTTDDVRRAAEERKLADAVYRKQSMKAFRKIVMQWQNYVYKWSFAACKQDQEQASDMAKNIFLDIWRELTEKQLEGSLESVIRRHVIHAVANQIRGGENHGTPLQICSPENKSGRKTVQV